MISKAWADEIRAHPGHVHWDGRWHEPEQWRRACYALDVIRAGVEQRLRLSHTALLPSGTMTTWSNEAYDPGDRRIVRAALKALTGTAKPRRSRSLPVPPMVNDHGYLLSS